MVTLYSVEICGTKSLAEIPETIKILQRRAKNLKNSTHHLKALVKNGYYSPEDIVERVRKNDLEINIYQSMWLCLELYLDPNYVPIVKDGNGKWVNAYEVDRELYNQMQDNLKKVYGENYKDVLDKRFKRGKYEETE